MLSQHTHRDLQQERLALNRVIVRIWTSAFNIHQPGENVGHVSLELEAEQQYISFWPKQAQHHPFEERSTEERSAKEREGLGLTSPISHEFVLNYAIERDEYEGRAPEYTFCLYTLDKEAIQNTFDRLQSSTKGWCLLGGTCENAESCVSFAWKLLQVGGIDRLLSRAEQATGSSVESGKGFSQFLFHGHF